MPLLLHFNVVCGIVRFFFRLFLRLFALGRGQLIRSQNRHEFHAGDGLLFQQHLGRLVQLFLVVAQNLIGLLIAVGDNLLHFHVDARRRLIGTHKVGIAAEILAGLCFQRHHAERVAHAEAGDHRAGKLGCLLDVVARAAGDAPKDELLRPGRFDRRIPVELPDLAGREAILRVHAKDVKTEPNIDYTQIARATSGCSGAELANIINEAAIAAVKDNRKAVSQRDLEEAIETVIAGYQRKNAVMNPEERRIVSYHEIGHALVAARQKNAVPIRKITIIPRTSGALGFTMQADEEEHVLMKKEDLIQQIEVLTAGRAAEELIFGTCTSGASNDIERATALARNMITRFGMNDEIGLMALDTVVNPYLDAELKSNASPEAAAKVEKEMRKLIQSAYERATQILRDNAATLNRLSQYLLENENITGDEFMALLKEDEERQSAESAAAEGSPEAENSREE